MQHRNGATESITSNQCCLNLATYENYFHLLSAQPSRQQERASVTLQPQRKSKRFLATINTTRDREKMAMKRMMKPIRMSMMFTKYNLRITTASGKDERIVPTELLMVLKRLSS